MNTAFHEQAIIKLNSRYMALRDRLKLMAIQPCAWPVAQDPLFQRFTDLMLDTDPTPDNIEQITSGINKLILVIDDEVDVLALAD